MSQSLFETVATHAQAIARAPRVLVGLDFDGTLAPLAVRPEEVRLMADVRQLLRALAQIDRVHLAIVSGRRAADVQNTIAVPGLIYGGNHGCEIDGPCIRFREPTALAGRAILDELCAELSRDMAPFEGAWVEHKGLSASVHYRQLAESARSSLKCLVADAVGCFGPPLCLTHGHAVWEIRATTAWNKGLATRWIQRQLGCQSGPVIYIGDDETDEDAFRQLDDGITVRVGAAEHSAARYHVNGPEDVARFLKWLACVLHTTPQPRA